MKRALISLLPCACAIIMFGHFTQAGLAHAGKKHPIDIKLEECRNPESTWGILACLDQARDEWEKAMTKAYDDLLSKENTPKQKKTLRVSQKRWLQFKHAEEAYLEAKIFAEQGTIWPIVYKDEIIDLYRKRAIQLLCHAEVTNRAAPFDGNCP